MVNAQFNDTARREAFNDFSPVVRRCICISLLVLLSQVRFSQGERRESLVHEINSALHACSQSPSSLV